MFFLVSTPSTMVFLTVVTERSALLIISLFWRSASFSVCATLIMESNILRSSPMAATRWSTVTPLLVVDSTARGVEVTLLPALGVVVKLLAVDDPRRGLSPRYLLMRYATWSDSKCTSRSGRWRFREGDGEVWGRIVRLD